MDRLRQFGRNYQFVLWMILFAVGYLVFAYACTHVVMSDAYVLYLESSLDLVNYGVVSYIMGTFLFYLICLAVAAAVTGVLLLLLRKGLVAISLRLQDRENIHRFATGCDFIMNFLLAVGFVFLLGIKDNFFEMFYVLFEEGLTELDLAIHRMAYDVEMNWIFCQLTVLKLVFDLTFSERAINGCFPAEGETAAPSEETAE